MDNTQFDWGVFWGACGAIFQGIALVIMLLQWKEFTNFVRKNTRSIVSRGLFVITVVWMLGFGGYAIYLTIVQLTNGIPFSEIITFKNEVMKWDTIALVGSLVFGYAALFLNGDISIDEDGNLIKTQKIDQ